MIESAQLRILERARTFLNEEHHRTLFDGARGAVLARAPGRLDVMGGIADYSGSLVLQMPIAEATWVLLARSSKPTISVASAGEDLGASVRHYEIGLEELKTGVLRDYASARRYFNENAEHRWAAYILGSLLVLAKREPQVLQSGLSLLVFSAVPEGKGVSSSAALEVATLHALVALRGLAMTPRQIATLAHEAENEIAGAPCGIMDQMTSECGREGELLRLCCQPDIIEGFSKIPEGLAIFGLDSGVRHAVSGSDYGSVRVGAFMGYRILLGDRLPRLSSAPTRAELEAADGAYRGYLANVSVSEWMASLADLVPERLKGKDFLERYGASLDRVTTVEPEREYAVRTPTAHPIYEHHRCRLFAALLENYDRTPAEAIASQLGELMYQSHESYGACGLGSEATDELVREVRRLGPSRGLYGARITGGGSGGTVAVLARKDAEGTLESVVKGYQDRTSRSSRMFRGTSPGACGVEVARTDSQLGLRGE